MDYDDPRSVFSGAIEAKIMNRVEIESALKAYQLFSGSSSYVQGYQGKLADALLAFETNKANIEKITLTIKGVGENER